MGTAHVASTSAYIPPLAYSTAYLGRDDSVSEYHEFFYLL